MTANSTMKAANTLTAGETFHLPFSDFDIAKVIDVRDEGKVIRVIYSIPMGFFGNKTRVMEELYFPTDMLAVCNR